MQFERSFDYGLITRLFRNPKLYDFISDDFAPPIEDVAPVENAELWYILARAGEGLLGCYLFVPRSHIVWEFHTVMPLDGRALAAMRELLGPSGWLWSHTECRRAVTEAPEHNAIARRFGERAGLRAYGRNPDSYQKLGVLQDLILMGASRPKDK